MLEYLAYAAFFIMMFGCVRYIMQSLESDGTPEDRNDRRRELRR
jgi:hypothetical protein